MMKQRKAILPMPARYAINTVLIVALITGLEALSVSGLLSDYFTKILVLVGINIILAVSLNVATGYLGQLPLGHAGFMAVGAYTGGIFLKAVNAASATGVWSVILIAAAILLSGAVAALFGIAIGVPALRLKGDYLAIITLGFG